MFVDEKLNAFVKRHQITSFKYPSKLIVIQKGEERRKKREERKKKDYLIQPFVFEQAIFKTPGKFLFINNFNNY